MRRAFAAVLVALVAAGPLPALAVTAPSLAGRIVIDGIASEYSPDESLFGVNGAGVREESTLDSAWGPDNDFNQIRITWDRDSIYVAAEGVIWGNNMIVLFDVVPDRGMDRMGQLNSWRRNFTFSDDFRPDLFLATWDGNASPRLLIHQSGSQVTDNQVGSLFRASATFSTGQRGRAMEFAIPWNTFFLGSEGLGTTPTFVPSLGETVHVFSPGTVIKVAGVITAGGDNTGGPDSAPDNTRGHVSDGAQDVFIDNFAMVALDSLDDSGLGGGGSDGVADWGIEPKAQTSFKFQPPVVAVRLTVAELTFDRPAFAPARGERARLRFKLEPPSDPKDPLSGLRTVNVSANVFNAEGRFVRNLFINEVRTPATVSDSTDVWDGRDEDGALVPGGVYVVRVVVEPSIARLTRPIVVVR